MGCLSDMTSSASCIALLPCNQGVPACRAYMSQALVECLRKEGALLGCRFHLVNQNLVIAGTNAGTVEVFNSSTGEPPCFQALLHSGA